MPNLDCHLPNGNHVLRNVSEPRHVADVHTIVGKGLPVSSTGNDILLMPTS